MPKLVEFKNLNLREAKLLYIAAEVAGKETLTYITELFGLPEGVQPVKIPAGILHNRYGFSHSGDIFGIACEVETNDDVMLVVERICQNMTEYIVSNPLVESVKFAALEQIESFIRNFMDRLDLKRGYGTTTELKLGLNGLNIFIVIKDTTLAERIEQEPFMAKLSSSFIHECTMKQIADEMAKLDELAIKEIWVPLATSYALGKAIRLTSIQLLYMEKLANAGFVRRSFLTSKDVIRLHTILPSLSPNSFTREYSAPYPWRLSNGVTFYDWIFEAGYACKDTNGNIFPRHSAPKHLRPSNVNPCSNGKEHIAYDTVRILASKGNY